MLKAKSLEIFSVAVGEGFVNRFLYHLLLFEEPPFNLLKNIFNIIDGFPSVEQACFQPSMSLGDEVILLSSNILGSDLSKKALYKIFAGLSAWLAVSRVSNVSITPSGE